MAFGHLRDRNGANGHYPKPHHCYDKQLIRTSSSGSNSLTSLPPKEVLTRPCRWVVITCRCFDMHALPPSFTLDSYSRFTGFNMSIGVSPTHSPTNRFHGYYSPRRPFHRDATYGSFTRICVSSIALWIKLTTLLALAALPIGISIFD